MAWWSLTLDVPEAHSELAQALVHELGAAGLELREAGQLVMPQVRSPNPGEAIIIASFDSPEAARTAREAVERQVPGARSALAPVVERDWSTEWRTLIKASTVGRLWVGPPWQAHQAPAGAVKVVIEPKMAFGTGDHPTTALCLQAVDEFLLAHPKATVLDVGTGSGVLAFGAKKLGAGRTVGLDNDPVAVELAEEGARDNGVEVELSTATLEEVPGRFDLVLANILANTLVELAPALAAKVGRRLVLAGVLVPQAEAVSQAYLDQGLRAAGQQVQGEWIRLDFDAAPAPARRRPAPAPRARKKAKSPVRARAEKKLKARPAKRRPRR